MNSLAALRSPAPSSYGVRANLEWLLFPKDRAVKKAQ
jgi:hypothetical protein